ncbi:olfactory receptor 14C36-like [Lonchura striata]
MSNSSSISHFLLLALADTRQLQLLHFCLFLGISLAALLGNGLIISAVACGHHLHTPMFFFLLNLALSDLGSICTTVPKAMHNSLWDTSTISYTGCAVQVFLIIFFLGSEYFLLTIMCYDCYVSICKPLHYGTLLGSRACAHMAAAAWASAFLNALLHTASTFSLPLCHGNALGQFFCEIPQILKLSCSNSSLRELGLLAFTACLVFGCFVFIVFSYVQIFRAVLRIPSEQGRHKAFSTCLPHLAVVSLFVSTGIFAQLKPPSISSQSQDLALTVLYSVVPPALNPLIYSLRNKELKSAVWRLMTGAFRNIKLLANFCKTLVIQYGARHFQYIPIAPSMLDPSHPRVPIYPSYLQQAPKPPPSTTNGPKSHNSLSQSHQESLKPLPALHGAERERCFDGINKEIIQVGKDLHDHPLLLDATRRKSDTAALDACGDRSPSKDISTLWPGKDLARSGLFYALTPAS